MGSDELVRGVCEIKAGSLVKQEYRLCEGLGIGFGIIVGQKRRVDHRRRLPLQGHVG